jgi:predicted dehydrogenase
MRIGIIGAGTMGARYAQRIAAGEFGADLQLAGIADLDLDRATAVAAPLPTEAYPTAEALLETARPDAVYIATPDGHHRAPALAAAEVAVPFLLEKPLATTIEDAQAIADAVEAAGIVAELNFSNRWNPPFVAAKQAIDRGELGDFVTLFTRLNNSIGSPTERLGWAGATTSGWFLLSHCLDLAYWLHGRRATSVYASGTRGVLESRGVHTYDSIHAIVRYEDGTDGSYESVWVLPDGMPAPVEFTFRYVGSEGAATIDTHEQNIALATTARLDYPGTLNWAPQRMADFVAAVRGEREPAVPIADGLETTRILVALHRSLETGAVEAV